MRLASLFSPSSKLRVFHLSNHLALVYGGIHYSSWYFLLSFLVWNILGTLGISIGFHRLLAHRSFYADRSFKIFCLALGCLATGGSPLTWAGVHRMHHAYTDQEGDPHSPRRIGFLNSYFHFWGPLQIRRRFLRDLLKDRDVRWLHRNYFSILGIWALALYALDARLGIFIYSVPAVMAFHAYGFINALGHRSGYQNYPTGDSSRNNWIVNILTCGEGWHNNHHYQPVNYRIGHKRWEWDQSAYLIEKIYGSKLASRAGKGLERNSQSRAK